MQRGPIHHFSASAIVSNPLKNSDKAQETIFHDFILKMTKDVGMVKNAAIHLLLDSLSHLVGHTKRISSFYGPYLLIHHKIGSSSLSKKKTLKRRHRKKRKKDDVNVWVR